MVESSSFRMPLTKWHHHLQDINFWLNGYINSPAYHNLEVKLDQYGYVQWNVGVGPTACFTRAISSITRDVKIRKRGPFDPVIEVDMKQNIRKRGPLDHVIEVGMELAASEPGIRFDINDMLHIKVAEQLGLLEHKYDMVDDAELRYYTYNMEKKQDDTVSPSELKYSIALQIMQNLRTKKYLLVVQNLDRPIKPIKLEDMTEGLWLPAPRWNGSFWIVSTTSQADVNHRYLTDGVSMVSMDDVPPFRERERHVEISAVERYPHGLKYLLEVTKSISMSDDTHVSCLNDLSRLKMLEECKLQRCHRVVHVFNDLFWLGRSLESAHVSHLKSLTHFYKESYFDVGFHALKHLRLEHCPRLEGVMPRGSALPSLVTLDILFCYNLKAIFYYNNLRSPSFELPCLRRIHLQELPLLEHLRNDDAVLAAPAWEELHVRGCWSLHRLPRLIDRRPGKKAVTVSGEQAWWTKLRWDDRDDSHRESYEPRLPPASASIRERVIIKTYLR